MSKEKLTPNEIKEIELNKREKRALEMHAAGASFPAIGEELFGGKMTRQGVCEYVRAAERKLWRLKAKERHADRLQNCPVAELPLPSRVRNALINSGLEKVSQIADLTREQLAEVPGLGKRHGSFLVYSLMQAWDVNKPNSFCAICGLGLKKKLRKGEELTCPHCGGVAVVRHVEPVEVTA